ncbi:hypothetical protein BUALT_Bualt02G0000300 [Buddleja alternifolia]|uniref:Protein kinase domain-containing protein n=1 Tax=Buddleja alternifolia TaxID=168488 RepID=A0AAV6Y717_9LAMI|nr:hypothetical protein BUALT_Bualt02G0000300 [Buddleja alternifolia]
MNPYPVSIALLVFCFLKISAATSNILTNHFTGDVSINCGSSGTSASSNGRDWPVDIHSKASSFLEIKGSSTTSTTVHISAYPVPYRTTRISRSQFSYEFFKLNSGEKILRLHFNPAPYKGFKRFKDLFTVEAGPFILLSNFSASLTADALGCPPGLYYFHGGDVNGVFQVVGQESLVLVDNNTALEIVHRLNIKHDSASSSADDTSDIFGMWETVNNRKANNITWRVSVDVGFRYLVRLHFSKLGFKMAETASLMFKIYINEMIANTNYIGTVSEGDEDNSIPWFQDYIVMMKGCKQEGKRDLLIHLQSNDEFIDGYGPLKGFEIMKLSNLENSLASPHPLPSPNDSSHGTIQNLRQVIGHRNTVATVAITILALVNITIHMLVQIGEATSIEEENMPSATAEDGFGKVYKGIIDNGRETVAIKRLKSNSKQGAREFLTEIETLTELRHVNLVSLIGYCSKHKEMFLIYEYVACGTLADHLYKLARNNDNSSSLTWKQRLNICIGAGRGLDYLHTGHSLVHRDVKASNILVDEYFTAKVSDFGLAKHENRSKLQSHVSTNVKGRFGYLDPHYLTTGKLTRKRDTYSFGVVLLEVLCGRPTLDTRMAEDEQILAKWARENINTGKIGEIVASNLRDEISKDSLKAFVEIAEKCLHEEPKKRPTMAQVVLQLEFALEQQESTKSLVPNRITSHLNDDLRPCNNETNLPVSNGQLRMASTDVQNFATPTSVDRKVFTAEPSRRKDKPLRLWPWDAFWKRVKTSTKNELLLSVSKMLGNGFKCQIDVPAIPVDEFKDSTDNFGPKVLYWNYGYNAAVARRSGGAAADSPPEATSSSTCSVGAIERYFVDLDFAAEFEIARPTNSYDRLFQCLPRVFVEKATIEADFEGDERRREAIVEKRRPNSAAVGKHRFMQNSGSDLSGARRPIPATFTAAKRSRVTEFSAAPLDLTPP